MARKTGSMRSKAALSPPTMTAALPCASVTGLPEIGASSMATPCLANSAEIARLASVTIENTTSEAAATARGVGARRMPAAINGSAFCLLRFQPVTAWPAAMSRGTMPAPMAPSPTKPMFMRSPRNVRAQTPCKDRGAWRLAHNLGAVKRILDAHSHRRHVGVAKAIVNNNPETMKLRRRWFPAAAGCVPPQAAEALASGHETSRAAAPPHTGRRNFGEYSFLEDSRYT